MADRQLKWILAVVSILLCLVCSTVEGSVCMTSVYDAPRLDSKTSENVLSFTRNARGTRTCYWLISTNTSCDSIIRLKLNSQTRGTLNVYDGPTTSNKLLSWNYNNVITSSGQFVFVVFQKQYYYTNSFSITYKDSKKGYSFNEASTPISNEEHEMCFSQPEILFATNSQNFIQSSGFRNNGHYGSGISCAWLISSRDPCDSVIRISFTSISTEAGYDIIRIYDGSSVESPLLGSFSGEDLPNPVTSSGGRVLVTFTTDDSKNFPGFRLSYDNKKALPDFLSNVKKYQNDTNVGVTVGFTSTSLPRSVQWLKNGILVYDDKDAIFADGDNIIDTQKEYKSTLLLSSLADDVFGTYKVSVGNDKGFSEKYVELDKPSTVTFGNYSISVNDDKIAIHIPVGLSSTYSEFQWFKDNTLVIERPHKYKMSVSKNTQGKQCIFTMEIISPELDDYTKYKLSLTSMDMVAEIYVHVQYPEKLIPIVKNYRSRIVRNNALISVSYASELPSSVKWGICSTTLVGNDKYRIDVDKATNATTLKIYSVNDMDFTTYGLSVTNEAGTRTVYIDLTKPQVFPIYASCNRSQTLNISCTIEDCQDKFLPWIHSINQTTIREIEGHVIGQTSTITISQCTAEDLGRYTCVTEKESENGTKTSVHRDSSSIEVHAPPVINSDIHVNVDEHRVTRVTVNVTANPPLRNIKWLKKNGLGDGIANGFAIKEQIVPMRIRDKVLAIPGYTVSLILQPSVDPDYGSYRFIAGNAFGMSEHNVELDNPEEGIRVLSHEITFSAMQDSAAVDMLFYCVPEYQSISWIHKETGVELKNSPKYAITTIPKEGQHRQYVARMNITKLIESDFADYKVRVDNGKTSTDFFVPLKNPEEGLPKLEEEQSSLDGNTAILSVRFTSFPAVESVTWYRNDVPLTSILKYNSTTKKFKLSKLDNHGSVFLLDGYENKLIISDVEDSDFGTYRVQLQNRRGYTQKLVSVTAGCQNNIEAEVNILYKDLQEIVHDIMDEENNKKSGWWFSP